MHTNEPQPTPRMATGDSVILPQGYKQWSALSLLGLGIFHCLIGLTMACNSTSIEAMQNFRESFNKMLSEPDMSYSFAQAVVVFYTVAGVIMIGLSLRKPTALRSVASFFGAVMLSIVVSKLLFGHLDLFIMFQLLVAIALAYCGYGVSYRTDGTRRVAIGTGG